jgi:hypothetical protein
MFRARPLLGQWSGQGAVSFSFLTGCYSQTSIIQKQKRMPLLSLAQKQCFVLVREARTGNNLKAAKAGEARYRVPRNTRPYLQLML